MCWLAVNKAGKSSIGGAAVRQHGGDYFNPDEAARTLREKGPPRTQADANGAAWRQGVRLLKRAIEKRLDFTFETTLGGNTITGLLAKAAEHGFGTHVWYVGLSSPELHIARVQARVRRGGTAYLSTTFVGVTNIAASTSSRCFPTSPPYICTTTARTRTP